MCAFELNNLPASGNEKVCVCVCACLCMRKRMLNEFEKVKKKKYHGYLLQFILIFKNLWYTVCLDLVGSLWRWGANRSHNLRVLSCNKTHIQSCSVVNCTYGKIVLHIFFTRRCWKVLNQPLLKIWPND